MSSCSKWMIISVKGSLKGIRDFVPETMGYSDMVELEHLLKSRRYLEFMGTEKKRQSNEGSVSDDTPGSREQFESGEVLTNNSKGQNVKQNGEISSELRVTEQDDPDAADLKQEDYRPVKFGRKRKRQPSTSLDLDETYSPEVDAQALEVKSGDEMETIPPANIG